MSDHWRTREARVRERALADADLCSVVSSLDRTRARVARLERALDYEAEFVEVLSLHFVEIVGEQAIGSDWLADARFVACFKGLMNIIGKVLSDRLRALRDEAAVTPDQEPRT